MYLQNEFHGNKMIGNFREETKIKYGNLKSFKNAVRQQK